eukprot:gene3676-7317_t
MVLDMLCKNLLNLYGKISLSSVDNSNPIAGHSFKLRTNYSNSHCAITWKDNYTKEFLTTFIVPSTGRRTLRLTLESLQNQTDPHWLAVVIMDGVIRNKLYLAANHAPIFLNLPDSILNDRRICFDSTPFHGNENNNCAGQIRNYAMRSVITPWISFVDDDDSLDHRYVNTLRNEIQLISPQKLHCVIFRMFTGDRIIPSINSTDFKLDDVGISFSLLTELIHNKIVHFNKSVYEDFIMLNTLRKYGYTITLSPHIMYNVNNNHPAHAINIGNRGNIAYNASEHMLTPFEVSRLAVTCQNHPKHATSPPPEFIFTEMNSKFFTHNIHGLNYSIHKAIHNGCMRNWKHKPMRIHIIFETQIASTTRYFIQMNMEQVRTSHFNNEYFQKLNKSTQVWDVSLASMKYYADKINPSTYFIPSILTLSTNKNNNKNIFQCANSIIPHKQSQGENQNNNNGNNNNNINNNNDNVTVITRDVWMYYDLYENGCIVSCVTDVSNSNSNNTHSMYTDTVAVRDTKCLPSNSSSTSNSTSKHRECNVQNPEFTQVCNNSFHTPVVDVLLYGLIECSDNRARESLCEQLQLHATDVRTVCLQGAFGSLLENFVCKAKIIVVPHYFNGSALETHRINPLLQAGKVVIVVSSTDPWIDNLYSSAVIISHPDELLNTIRKVLHNFSFFESKLKIQAHSLIKRTRHALDPLCNALFNLQYSISSMYSRNDEEEYKYSTNKYKKSTTNKKDKKQKKPKKRVMKPSKDKYNRGVV